MPLTRFSIIVKGPGYNAEVHQAILTSPLFSTTLICVSDFEQAVTAALDLMRDGIQLIELCGGFSPDEAAELYSRTGNQVPVGVVRYSPEEQQQLSNLFGEFRPDDK